MSLQFSLQCFEIAIKQIFFVLVNSDLQRRLFDQYLLQKLINYRVKLVDMSVDSGKRAQFIITNCQEVRKTHTTFLPNNRKV